MSRASKIASARGQAHTARHATNVARAKLRRVTDERDQLRARIESLSPFPTEALASLETANAELRACVAEMEKVRTEPVATVMWGANFGSMEFTGSAELSGLLGRYSHGSLARLYAVPPDAAAIIAKLTQERDEALLIHQTDTGTESAVAKLQAEVERLRAELAATNALADRLSQQSSEYFMGKERAEKQLAAMQAKEVRK